MSRNSVSKNSNKNNKINKVNSKKVAYYLELYNNTVIPLNLVGYNLIQKVTDMFSSNHHLSLYTKLMTVLNKEDYQSMK